MRGLSVAIVGAGASGCYAAQALGREFGEAEITVLERLPVPYGLVRYGVAADHQGTKGIQHQFERMFTSSGVEFVGGMELGRHVTLDQLAGAFGVVVLATGVPDDRRLGVPGDTLAGMVGAGRLTRALNSHPEDCLDLPVLPATVAIVGSGNVAIDVVRALSKAPAEWDGSDMDEHVLAEIVPDPIREIHLVSRSSADAARWDWSAIKELSALRRPTFRLATGDLDPHRSRASMALSDLVTASPDRAGDLTVNVHLECVVERVVGHERVAGITIRSAAGETRELAAGAVVTAIGFDPGRAPHAPPGVYTTGWLRTGPRGTIPDQRVLAKQLVSEIRAAFEDGRVTIGRPGRAALPLASTTDFAGWRRIDELERARAPDRRVRRKLTRLQEMHAAAGATRSAQPAVREMAV